MAAVALLAAATASASPASADPFGVGGSNTGWLADNHDHDWCWSTNFTAAADRTKATAAEDYLNSSTSFSGGTLEGCGSGTDVYWKMQNTTAWRGLYSCQDRSGNVCDNANVTISSNTGTLPVAERRKTMCHELGHSTGATHHSDAGWGCMISGTSTSQVYSTHTKDHMNNLRVATA